MITWRTRLNIENPDTTEENHEVEVHLIAKVWANIVKTRVSGQEGGTWFEVLSLNEDAMYRSNQYMSNTTKNMCDLVDISDLKLTIGHPNGTLANITHVRNLNLNNDVVLFDVLVKQEYYYDNSAVSNQILVRYASGKKSYKLYSLENRSVLYYRDVKFYETVFPMKMSNNESASESNEISSLNFFEHFESKLATNTPKLRPNDDEERTPGKDGSVHQPVHGAISDQPGYDEQHSTTPICEQNHFD
ncbi:hypothetical protein Tco_1208730 [Tanacetum coccineum]